MNIYGDHETAEETVALSHNDNSKKTVLIKKTNFTSSFVWFMKHFSVFSWKIPH